MRRIACAAAFAILLCAFAVAGAPSASAQVVVAERLVLPPNTANETGWLTVTPGHAVLYQTSTDAYISYWAEVEGRGSVDGGDGGGMRGCLSSDHTFRFRLGWSNNPLLVGSRAVNVSYELDVSDPATDCHDLEQALAAEAQADGPIDQVTQLLDATPLFVAAMAVAASAVGILLWRILREPPARPSRPAGDRREAPPPKREG